ncbi:YbbC/YhhH family protein [Flavobacterium lacus]|uniref:NTF2 fold immunity protein of polymorphic toxin system component n=1 Tax=Flavobacterium lacus TaxID=1353778 RepID=A0A328X2R5_9FLAO|nr:YbbC/YhhH family protein [Flavobacterium lacus]RAR49698.1 NTF2 fold immunity protein of polymorphic toxin system component [Flavobacterium lacus]
MKQLLLLFILFSLFSCSTKKYDYSEMKKEQEFFERFLKIEIALIEQENPELNIGTELILKDSTAAVEVAEVILFNIYGKKNIIKQRPYTILPVQDKYWVMEGSLPKNTKGGVFFIILDARNSKVLKVKHGK